MEQKQGKIFFTQIDVSEQGIVKALGKLDALERGGVKVQARDEMLMKQMHQGRMLTLDHVHRLGWPGRKSVVAQRRMNKLIEYELVAHARHQGVYLQQWGLTTQNIYTLNVAGMIYQGIDELPGAVDIRHTVPGLVLRDVLLAEVFVRLVEAVEYRGNDWDYTWVAPPANLDPELLLLPAATIIIRRQGAIYWAAFIHLYLGDYIAGLTSIEEQPSPVFRPGQLMPEPDLELEKAPWRQMVSIYDQIHRKKRWREQPELAELEQCPAVVIIVRDETLVKDTRRLIELLRERRVVYLVTTWDRLLATTDILTVKAQRTSEYLPKWRPLTPLPPVHIPPVEQRSQKTRSALLRAGRISGAIPEQANLINLDAPEKNWDKLRQRRR